MISLEDCIGMCGLDENEVAAISEHEHIPEIWAAALASYLLKQPHGGEAIRTMIIDDIRKELDEGHIKHAAELFMRREAGETLSEIHRSYNVSHSPISRCYGAAARKLHPSSLM
jgi:hypothetical protein